MRKTTRLRQLIEAPELLIMPGTFDPISAKLIEQAGFQAIQCSGLALAASHLGKPDVSIISMREMVERTYHVAHAVDIPVMGDGDTGFGNAVNAHYTAQEFERSGAAGVNLEDQVMPKRCGHLRGKEVVPLEEMVLKIRAARDALLDPDFVINARTDALAVHGVAEVVRRGNAYLEAGATMIFADGVGSRDQIRALVSGIHGPVGINMVEGGRTPSDLTFTELQALGVARVSLPLTTFLAAIRGIQNVLRAVRAADGIRGYEGLVAGFEEMHELIGMGKVYELEQKYLVPETLARKYNPTKTGGA
jgi:2-methylisocitrate lyase-like PEP mutase family enzyme